MRPMQDELLDIKAACAMVGGTKPICPSTYYRGVKAGIYPAPDKVGPNTARVRKSKLIAALNARFAPEAAE